jgi:hypothetical protein
MDSRNLLDVGFMNSPRVEPAYNVAEQGTFGSVSHTIDATAPSIVSLTGRVAKFSTGTHAGKYQSGPKPAEPTRKLRNNLTTR